MKKLSFFHTPTASARFNLERKEIVPTQQRSVQCTVSSGKYP